MKLEKLENMKRKLKLLFKNNNTVLILANISTLLTTLDRSKMIKSNLKIQEKQLHGLISFSIFTMKSGKPHKFSKLSSLKRYIL